MKKEKKNIREPYDPKRTPKPPQIIEPNRGAQRENPIEKKEDHEGSSAKPAQKNHLLSENADIDDETTI